MFSFVFVFFAFCFGSTGLREKKSWSGLDTRGGGGGGAEPPSNIASSVA